MNFPPITTDKGSPNAKATALSDCIGMLLRALGEPGFDDAAAAHAGFKSVANVKQTIRKMHRALNTELLKMGV